MLEEKIYKDYVLALKDHDKAKTDFLSFVRAELKNAAIDLRKKHLDDPEVITVLKKQKKRLQDSRESILSSGREDLLQAVEKELELINVYLPQPFSSQQLSALVDTVVAETGASSMKDMGTVMKEVIARAAGRADSKQTSDLVRAKLSSL